MAISEIYCKLTNDPYFESDRLEVTSDIEALIEKIRMVMLTKKGDVLGEPEFGVDLEKYIFETFFDRRAILSEINNQFSKYIPEQNRYDLNTKVDISKGEFRDNIIVDIFINQEKILGFAI
jgi:phage baseplate assembly protein W